MPTDLTGTPTSLGIGTFNVDADAPSGLGFNEAMAQIDALIGGRIATPAGIVSGEVPVWNGTTFVRSSVLPITANGIGSGVVKSPYRKNTTQGVVNTVAETDLLNGEITLPAGKIGATDVVRLTAWGDWRQFSGATQATPRFKFKLGATTLLDTNVVAGVVASLNGFNPWSCVIDLVSKGATNSQFVHMRSELAAQPVSSSAVGFTTGNGIYAADSTTHWFTAFGYNDTAVDMTLSQAVILSVILPAANTNLSFELKGATLEII